jgi:hypothetical protein
MNIGVGVSYDLSAIPIVHECSSKAVEIQEEMLTDYIKIQVLKAIEIMI